jgi:hypothetical protein
LFVDNELNVSTPFGGVLWLYVHLAHQSQRFGIELECYIEKSHTSVKRQCKLRVVESIAKYTYLAPSRSLLLLQSRS